jgi:hypothetical protein
MMYTKQMLLDLDDLPFYGGYDTIAKSKKDVFGNVIKNVAKHLAKLGLKKVLKNG